MKSLRLALVVAWCPVIMTGCHLLGSAGEGAGNVDPLASPPAAEGQHFTKSGPLASVDRGPGNKTVLRDFVETTEQLNQQKNVIVSLTERLKLLQQDKQRLQMQLESEKNLRVGAEAERDSARQEVKENSIEILNLALQKTRSDKERYRVMIAKNELEDGADE